MYSFDEDKKEILMKLCFFKLRYFGQLSCTIEYGDCRQPSTALYGLEFDRITAFLSWSFL